MVNEIVVVPATILRKKSLTIKEITPKVKDLALEMVNFMDSHSKDDRFIVGLSAIQLGHPVRMITFRSNPESLNKDDIVVLINPVLVYAKKQYTVREGCLSIPGKIYSVRRSKIVKIRGKTLDNVPHSFRGRDLLAQVFQHELDHLDGVLIDSIGELMRK